ncbi:hypothetical protein BDQ17DRAFT_1407055 [Cyathus striatus]|nr:hypothetical protein BDQ17DRAFT_1407055 [Cyathus striatus]
MPCCTSSLGNCDYPWGGVVHVIAPAPWSLLKKRVVNTIWLVPRFSLSQLGSGGMRSFHVVHYDYEQSPACLTVYKPPSNLSLSPWTMQPQYQASKEQWVYETIGTQLLAAMISNVFYGIAIFTTYDLYNGAIPQSVISLVIILMVSSADDSSWKVYNCILYIIRGTVILCYTHMECCTADSREVKTFSDTYSAGLAQVEVITKRFLTLYRRVSVTYVQLAKKVKMLRVCYTVGCCYQKIANEKSFKIISVCSVLTICLFYHPSGGLIFNLTWLINTHLHVMSVISVLISREGLREHIDRSFHISDLGSLPTISPEDTVGDLERLTLRSL